MKKPGEHDIRVVYDGLDITQMVTGVEWRGDLAFCSRILDVSLKNTTDGRRPLIKIKKGAPVIFYNYGIELFRGFIFYDDINHKGDHSFTAYDVNIYLNKNYDSKIFRKKTATQIIKILCGEFQIPIGTVADTGYVIPKLIFRNNTLWDIMLTAVTETRDYVGRKYVFSSKQGKLHLTERKEQLSKWMLEAGSNILGANYSQSIEDTVTQVKVYASNFDNGKQSVIHTAKRDDLISQLGVMQRVIEKGDQTNAQAAQLARQTLEEGAVIFDEATVEALGIAEVIAGSSIYAREPMTGIAGAYYVISDRHRFVGGTHTMDLKLSATDDLPALQYTDERS